MNVENKSKVNSSQYGEHVQLRQAQKYRNRRNNHWKFRIELAHNLTTQYVLSRLKSKSTNKIIVVDVGCSIGTFAIEFAKLGYRAYGIDFSPAALEIAKQLCEEEKVSAEFICGDIADWSHDFPPIDIAICFDIFEHLHDDELGSLLTSLRKQLSQEGSLIFHTFPTQYDYIFFGKNYFRYPLLPFKYLSCSKFEILVKAYASLLDMLRLLTKGVTHREQIKARGHCNPTTQQRLADILQRSGYDIVCLESSQLYPSRNEAIQRQFSKQPIAHRNLYGVAMAKSYLTYSHWNPFED